MKKSGFADWNTTTFADGSASRSVISAPNSTIVVGANMLIGGLLKLTVQRPGQVRSVLNCEGSGIADLLCVCGTYSGRFAEGLAARAKLFGKEHRLFPGGKMPASLEFVVIDEFRIRPFRPTPRGWIQLVRKHAHGNGDGDAFGIEIPEFAPILPIETGARKRRVRQPGDGDVVEDVVAREAFGFSLKDACDQLVAARIVIEEISRQADG